MPAVDECERDAASAAGMIAMIGAGTVQPPPWMANGGRRGQVSAFGTKAVQRGVHSVHRGEWTPLGLWAVGTNEPHARDKTVHGRRRRRMVVDVDKFPCLERKPLRGSFIRSTGANAAYWPTGGRGESHSPETSVHSPIPAFGRMLPVCRTVECPLDGNRPYSLVTRIHPPIKGKAQKNAFL